MKKKIDLIAAGVGVWASGLLVGVNAADFLPKASWPPWLMVAIGLLVGVASFAALFRASR